MKIVQDVISMIENDGIKVKFDKQIVNGKENIIGYRIFDGTEDNPSITSAYYKPAVPLRDYQRYNQIYGTKMKVARILEKNGFKKVNEIYNSDAIVDAYVKEEGNSTIFTYFQLRKDKSKSLFFYIKERS